MSSMERELEALGVTVTPDAELATAERRRRITLDVIANFEARGMPRAADGVRETLLAPLDRLIAAIKRDPTPQQHPRVTERELERESERRAAAAKEAARDLRADGYQPEPEEPDEPESEPEEDLL